MMRDRHSEVHIFWLTHSKENCACLRRFCTQVFHSTTPRSIYSRRISKDHVLLRHEDTIYMDTTECKVTYA